MYDTMTQLVIVLAISTCALFIMLERTDGRLKLSAQRNRDLQDTNRRLQMQIDDLQAALQDEYENHDLTSQALRYQTKHIERLTGKPPVASSLLEACVERPYHSEQL